MNDEDEDWLGRGCHCGDDGEDGDDFFLMLDIAVLMLDLFWSLALSLSWVSAQKMLSVSSLSAQRA